jgi:hypothetical protein
VPARKERPLLNLGSARRRAARLGARSAIDHAPFSPPPRPSKARLLIINGVTSGQYGPQICHKVSDLSWLKVFFFLELGNENEAP